MWISGLEGVHRRLGLGRVFDLSATPFFLRGSGYPEGTLFPWTMSDFSLMDAIESGIVKLPRVPVADDLPSADVPMYRELWKHIGKKMPKGRRTARAAGLDPQSLPLPLQNALDALYGHYEKVFAAWDEADIVSPPCFILVCNNTTTSKLLYDYISGYERQHDDGSSDIVPGRLELFRNFDHYRNPLPRPRTLLIDSAQLESGEGLDKAFRVAAADEIERFRREEMDRTGDRVGADSLTDEDLLREVMNTVGKQDRLGGSIRCVVSVSMLTEGLGCEHRHPHPRRARLRYTAPLRAGDRSGPAAAVLRTERQRPVRCRVRRCLRGALRLHGRTGSSAAAGGEADDRRAGDQPGPGPRRDSLPPASRATAWNCRRIASSPSSRTSRR